MRKLFGCMVLLVVVTMAVAGVATAGSNYSNGTTITGTGTNIAFGGFITCSSSISGSLTNLSPGATVLITSATFTACQPSGASGLGCNIPSPGWDHSFTSTADDNVWSGAISNLCVDMTTALTGSCGYKGTASGVAYTNSTHVMKLSGSLPLVSGGPLCPNPAALSGSYTLTPADFAINTM